MKSNDAWSGMCRLLAGFDDLTHYWLPLTDRCQCIGFIGASTHSKKYQECPVQKLILFDVYCVRNIHKYVLSSVASKHLLVHFMTAKIFSPGLTSPNQQTYVRDSLRMFWVVKWNILVMMHSISLDKTSLISLPCRFCQCVPWAETCAPADMYVFSLHQLYSFWFEGGGGLCLLVWMDANFKLTTDRNI